MGVEDKARQAPITSEASNGLPNAQAVAPMAKVVTATCSMPKPNTMRRMVHSRSNDSSRPMVNSRNTMPSSASWSTVSCEVMAMTPSHGQVSASRPRLCGPSARPATRKPSTGLTRSRVINGMTTPAVPRNTKASR
jgi:hypothetical protein